MSAPRRDTVLTAYDTFAGVASAYAACQRQGSAAEAGALTLLYAGHAVMRRLRLEDEDCDPATLREARQSAATALAEIRAALDTEGES